MPISSLVKGTLAEAAAARGWSQDSQPMAWFGTSWAAYSPLNHTQRPSASKATQILQSETLLGCLNML